MEKLRMESPDLTARNIRRLGELFPGCVTETAGPDGTSRPGVNFKLLRQLLGGDGAEPEGEAYELTWVGKRAAALEACAPIRKTLRPCPEESVDWDSTRNLYIEGENLDVLKLLQENYLNGVKMIYIDPPYNRGGDQFVYPDNYSMDRDSYEEGIGLRNEVGDKQFRENNAANPRFHSDWCSMIYARLLLARSLLAEDGVIFISQDDSEIANLRKICDEVFGASNFAGQITVVGNPRGRDYGGIARMHDYVLAYKKSPAAHLNLIEDKEGAFKLFDASGGFELRELRNRNIKFNKENRPNLYYPFYIDLEHSDENGLHPISLEPEEGWLELYPQQSQGVSTVWRWSRAKAVLHLNDSILAKPMRGGGYMIVEKYREAKVMARSVWWDRNTNTEKGTLLVKEMMDGKVFDYPKPVEMLMRLCEMGTNSTGEDIVLDFFSGSASTAHAVMRLNERDGGDRRFIMIQLPEPCLPKTSAAQAGYPNICEIGKERLRRAGSRLQAEGAQGTDTGFRVFRLDESSMKDIYYTPEELNQSALPQLVSNIREDRTGLDLLFSCLLDWGLPLSMPYTTQVVEGCAVHIYNSGDLIACFDQSIPEPVVEWIAARRPRRAVFRDAGFAGCAAKLNVLELFKRYMPESANDISKRVKVI